MLSRVAENIYWMARYLERAEDTARLINSTSNLLLDLPRNAEMGWYELIRVFGAEIQFKELYPEAEDERTVIKFLINDKANRDGIVNCIRSARENARVTRDMFPFEMWEQINELYYYSTEHARASLSRRKRHEFLCDFIRGCQTMIGITMSTLPQDEAYQFLRFGRNLERADMSSRIIDVAAAQLLPEEEDINPAFATIRWMGVLRSLSAVQAYRQQGLVGISGSAVLQYLIQSREFPRSMHHCLLDVSICLKSLDKSYKPRRRVNALLKEIETVDIKALRRSGLHQYIDDFQLGVGNLHEAIADTYFSYH